MLRRGYQFTFREIDFCAATLALMFLVEFVGENFHFLFAPGAFATE
jgi:hypothetical protein